MLHQIDCEAIKVPCQPVSFPHHEATAARDWVGRCVHVAGYYDLA